MKHSNKYHADAACEICGGVIRHESWCMTQSDEVRYIFEAFLDEDKLTTEDRLRLRSLGVIWQDIRRKCAGKCE